MPKPLKRTFIAILLALAIHSLLGFLILPKAALYIANEQLKQYATVPAKLERIELNPFTLELTLYGFSLGEGERKEMALSRLYADLEWNSIWQGVLHLAKVQLEQPQTQIRLAKDGTLNLTKWFRIPESSDKKDPDSGLFPIVIDDIQLVQGQLRFQDQSKKEPIDLAYDGLNLSLQQFSTQPDKTSQAKLVATSKTGGRLQWQGQLQLAPVFRSNGQLQLDELDLKAIRPYVNDAVPLAIQEGKLTLSSNYKMGMDKAFTLNLDDTALKLTSISINSNDGRSLIRLADLQASKSSVDLAKQQVVIGQLSSHKLETWAAREADGELDWQKLFATNAKTGPANQPKPAGQAAKPEAIKASEEKKPGKKDSGESNTAPWQVILRNVQLRDYLVHLTDRTNKEPVSLDLGPLNVDIQNFDSLGKTPFQLALDSTIGKQGQLKAKGQLQLTPATGKLQVTTRNIDLRVAQAYLTPFVQIELRSGMLSSDLNIDLKGTEPLALSVTGRAEVTQLHTLDTQKERDLLKWRSLLLEGIDYRHQDSLNIASINLTRPYARFIINPGMTTNINELMVQSSPDSASNKNQRVTKASKTKTPPVPASAKSPQEKPMGIHIGGIKIVDGSGDFADLSLRPNFITAIQNLNGQIGTLDNRNARYQSAKVDIKGKVNKYAPVTIKGHLNPFDPLQSLDIATSFHQVELTTLTPYSGKFAGYRIRKGRMDLDLHYRIQKGQLNAENKVVIDQLQLGEKVDSENAVDLPIRLAIALLKDSKGVITLELPVEGNLNDPQFSILPIIGKVLRNLLVKTVQAPFKLIGGLLGSGESSDLSQVDFAPGTTELESEARSSLDKLIAALKERPGLTLEIEGTASANDGPILAQQRLEQEYRDTWYRILQRRGDKVPAEASQLKVNEKDKATLLEGIYRARLKQQPPADWKKLDKQVRTEKMRQAVIDSWSSNPGLQRRLGQARAAAIKDYLVSRGLADQRIYLIDTNIVEPEDNGRVASALHLNSE